MKLLLPVFLFLNLYSFVFAGVPSHHQITGTVYSFDSENVTLKISPHNGIRIARKFLKKDLDLKEGLQVVADIPNDGIHPVKLP
jgi:hypothetical protein